jgi:hypothetical protein
MRILQGVNKKLKSTISYRDFSNRHLKFLVAYLLPFIFILVYYVAAYARYPSINLPIGWDTPWYINAINLAKIGNFPGLLQISYYSDFLYPLLVSFLPLNAFQIETYVPIFLNLLLPIIVYIFVKRTSTYSANIAMASTCAWFVAYRLAGLNSNLLSIILCLLTASLFLGFSSFTNKKAVLAFALLIISSFVGFEVTLFFAAMTFLALLVSRKGTRNKYSLLITGLIPSSLFYVYSKLYRVQIEGALATGSGAITSDVFLYSFGLYLIPLVICGAYFIISKRDRSLYDYFVFGWALLPLLLVSANFFMPIKNFAERSLALFPSIFLALPLIDEINRKRPLLEKRFFRSLIGMVLASLTITACFTASFSYGMYPKQFLSEDIYDELEYLHGYLKQTNASTIIVYNVEWGVVEFYANWAQAIDGKVLQYYGSISNLLSLSKGYDNAISRRLYSQGGFDKMNISTLINYKLVIVQQFYVGEIPSSLQEYSCEIYRGVTVVNLAALSKMPNFTESVYSLWTHSGYGSWYYNKDAGALEIYSNDTQNPYVLLNLDLPFASVYNVTLRYWDGSRNIGLKMNINDNTEQQINYGYVNTFADYSELNMPLNLTNTLKIEAFRISMSSMYFARLESITISPNPWSNK